jgi:FMN-dependent oxidoreductase (nitrilotriacetate monooxygenase family)
MTRKQIILGAYLGGVNHHTLWSHPDAGSQIDFSSFEHTARTAERGKFDFFFLAEGLALRERDGQVFDQDVVGRPDTFTVLASLAAVTEHLGLAGTINATFNEPYELARQLASLDHLSGGRAAWNVVTSFDAFTGQNFRRGGFLDRSQRYVRAEESLAVVRELWDSWADDAIVADRVTGEFLRGADAAGRLPGDFDYTGSQFDVRGRFTVPRSPQGRPVILQAGVSPQGRDFAAANSDAIFSPFTRLDEAQSYYRDIRERAARFGRAPGDVKILPSGSFVLGDTQAEAEEKARWVRDQQVTGRTALILLEQIWNRDLSTYDPEGPLPDVDPDVEAPSFIQGRALLDPDRVAWANRLRARAEENGFTLRETVIDQFSRAEFVGTPQQVADQIDDFVQNDGSDGFIVGSHLVPTGLDEFVDRVVPLLQERGSLRTEYTGTTLRENLGLPVPGRERVPGREQEAELDGAKGEVVGASV